MSDALRIAARAALDQLEGDSGGPSAEITRLTMDVEVDGQAEIVTVALVGDALKATSTGGDDGPHLRAALRWLADDVRASDPGLRVTESVDSPRVSWVPDEPEPEDDSRSPRVRLADALDDVVTTLVRAGLGVESVSVSESIERLRKEAPLPLPTGLARWLGRLREADERKSDALVARLLDGASQLAEDLRRERPNTSAKRRVAGWLGSGEPGTVERVSDRTLIEVAREQLASVERGGIERRYLVDTTTGEVYREERSRSSPLGSVGPCPRLVSVGLAEIEQGPAPRRIRLMQYAISLDVGRDELAKVAGTAYRSFSALAEVYRKSLSDHPGQAEPFAIVAPKAVRGESKPISYDDDGSPLAFARGDNPATVQVLSSLIPNGPPRWIAGRLVDHEGAMLLVPCSVGLVEGEGTRLTRLR